MITSRGGGQINLRRCSFGPGSDLKNQNFRTSLVIQWLRLHAANAGGTGLIPAGRSHMLQGSARKVWMTCHIKKKKNQEISYKNSLVAEMCPTLCNPMDYIAHQAPLSMEFSKQEYWSGCPFPSPRDLPDPVIEPRSLALQADSLPSEPIGSCSSNSGEGMATHSSILAWRIPGIEEPDGLPSMGLHRVGHDWSNLAVAAAQTLTPKAWGPLVRLLPWLCMLAVREAALLNSNKAICVFCFTKSACSRQFAIFPLNCWGMCCSTSGKFLSPSWGSLSTYWTSPTSCLIIIWILGDSLSHEGIILASLVPLGNGVSSARYCHYSLWPQDITVEEGLGAVWVTSALAANPLLFFGTIKNTGVVVHIPTFPYSTIASPQIPTVQGWPVPENFSE